MAEGAEGQLTDVNTVVVPVTAGHVLIDICVDPRHGDGREGVAGQRPDDTRGRESRSRDRGLSLLDERLQRAQEGEGASRCSKARRLEMGA